MDERMKEEMEEEVRPRKKGVPNSKLKHEREKRFWTLEDVSTRIGNLPGFAPGEPDPRTVGRWERGISFPSPRYSRALCNIFQMDAQALGLLLPAEDDGQELSAPEQDVATLNDEEADSELIPQTPAITEAHPPTTVPAESKQPGIAANTQDTHGQAAITNTSASLEQRSRQRLLKRLRALWITHVFAQSLQYAPLLLPAFVTRPDAVVNPWQDVLQESKQTARPLPPGTSIQQLYAASDGALLLLGDAGSGKTTLLLELTNLLLERAEQDPAQPLPVVLVLSTWHASRCTFTGWLLEELEQKYEVPRAIGEHWLRNDQLLLLLDSLDEVAGHARQSCIRHINRYRRAHPFVSIVVGCRSADYLAQPARLRLQQAVQIEALRPEQVSRYLAESGDQLAGLHTAFRQLAILQEFVTTPLRLSILAQAWQNMSEEELRQAWSTGSAQQRLCAVYVERMLARRGGHPYAPPQQTLHWLAQLAHHLHTHHLHAFSPEQTLAGWLLIKAYYKRIVANLTNKYLIADRRDKQQLQEQQNDRIQRYSISPWQHRRFLDYAAERLLLCKEEGGYAFAHPLLFHYFAQGKATGF